MSVLQTVMVMLLVAIGALAAAPGPTKPASFQGVALGESADDVFKSLGVPLKDETSSTGLVWTYAADQGNARLVVWIAKGRVIGVAAWLYGFRSSLADSYRIALGDAIARVRSLRGRPDFERELDSGELELRYGTRGDDRWTYGIRDDRVESIDLAAAPVWDSWSFPVPAHQATPWPTLSMAGVMLGENADVIRRQLGVPNEDNSDSGLTLELTYRFDANQAALDAGFSHGVVTSLQISLRSLVPSTLSDPFGIALGDSPQKLLAVRGKPETQTGYLIEYEAGPGVSWRYSLEHDRVVEIDLDPTVEIVGPPPDTAVGDDGRDGTTPAKAIASAGTTIDDTAAWESLYMSSLRCDGQGVWYVKEHHDVKTGDGGKARVLGQYDAHCTTSGRANTFYFDHTAAALRG